MRKTSSLARRAVTKSKLVLEDVVQLVTPSPETKMRDVLKE